MSKGTLAVWLGVAALLYLMYAAIDLADKLNHQIDQCDDPSAGAYIADAVERARVCGQ
ncbi:hypothetical protein [Rhizobium sp. FKY42]|uniref:hypothetical protein n=1 Tax=Rhizobium sp. FKY42 TaxID=2562310 RepID=UPI001485506D|nr:hypothetical protein [Rhizobium sp. FKY42]